MPGDIVEGDREEEKEKEFESYFRKIKSKYGVYATFGNHEHYGNRAQCEFFENAGIRLINDEVLKIDESFYLAGRYDSHFSKRKPVDSLLTDTTDTLPLILLDHRPTDIERVSRTKVDLQVSGHTHNGQLFPFGFIIKRVYILGWGYRKIGNTHFVVTCGVQTWGPPVKTSSFSEIVVINLKLKE